MLSLLDLSTLLVCAAQFGDSSVASDAVPRDIEETRRMRRAIIHLAKVAVVDREVAVLLVEAKHVNDSRHLGAAADVQLVLPDAPVTETLTHLTGEVGPKFQIGWIRSCL